MAFAAINTIGQQRPAPAVESREVPAVDQALIDHAFAGDLNLRKRVFDAIRESPEHGPLFEDIARYTSALQTRLKNQLAAAQSQSTPEEPNPKKRKIVENGDSVKGGPAATAGSVALTTPNESLLFYMNDVSFSVPQRKKLTLEVTGRNGAVRARNQSSQELEFGIPVSHIQHVICLPVPEKSQRQFNFCIIPRYGDGISPAPEGEAALEPMVWTVADGTPKSAYNGAGQQFGDREKTEALIRRVLNESLHPIKVVRPGDKEFVSAMPEAHRKGEKAYHVKAFRGSKEGYLFFLSTGIFFGFKKPLLFFAFENIESISYTSVLQRTFNLIITTRTASNQTTQDYEFSMIDQADYAGLDAYVKRHGLQDASLAEARRAKKYQGEKGAEGAASAEERESELQKAQRELEDREDEEEEDYEPGSDDDDSDGSGSDSEEYDENEGDRDLVQEELGSEAEEAILSDEA
ncbi:hypothetical protein VTN31DRAFT_2153 [Thermomyces dupontii]|uniref:uncharacterized protein n=1 Tax=Talaromyces thermophilus TaxID=28565 RepID=UPI003743151F